RRRRGPERDRRHPRRAAGAARHRRHHAAARRAAARLCRRRLPPAQGRSMSAPTLQERLYALLPTVHRARDAEAGQALRARLAVAEEQLAAVEQDVARLYESWFIETCAEWVVPYIGDLLGVRGLNAVTPRTYSQRAYVANILSYRRRKGTAAMLEQLAQD